MNPRAALMFIVLVLSETVLVLVIETTFRPCGDLTANDGMRFAWEDGMRNLEHEHEHEACFPAPQPSTLNPQPRGQRAPHASPARIHSHQRAAIVCLQDRSGRLAGVSLSPRA